MMEHGTALREIMRRKGATHAPGAHDTTSARIIEQAGFEVVWLGGFGTSATLLGMPDANVITLPEQLAMVRSITRHAEVPLIVDVDNGYGNAINVMRVVHEFEQAGAAALVFEDQVLPKRCGLYPGQRPIIDAEEHAGKIRAAVEARTDPGLVIVARTDAFSAGYDVDEALRRATLYADAGADAILVISKQYEKLAAFAGEWDHDRIPQFMAPTLFPERTIDEIGQLGVKIVIRPLMALQAAVYGMRKAMDHLREQGRPDGFEQRVAFEELLELVNLQQIAAYEADFLPGGTSLEEAVAS